MIPISTETNLLHQVLWYDEAFKKFLLFASVAEYPYQQRFYSHVVQILHSIQADEKKFPDCCFLLLNACRHAVMCLETMFLPSFTKSMITSTTFWKCCFDKCALRVEHMLCTIKLSILLSLIYNNDLRIAPSYEHIGQDNRIPRWPSWSYPGLLLSLDEIKGVTSATFSEESSSNQMFWEDRVKPFLSNLWLNYFHPSKLTWAPAGECMKGILRRADELR